MMAKTKKVRADETRAERFVRLAEWRVSKALAELRRIGNLASPVNYEYTEKQVKAIYTALTDAIRNIAIRFDEPCSAEKEDFKLVDWIVNGDNEIDKRLEDDDLEGYEVIEHDDQTG